jgi:hypothetical protein
LALLPGDLRNGIVKGVWVATPEFARSITVLAAFLAE